METVIRLDMFLGTRSSQLISSFFNLVSLSHKSHRGFSYQRIASKRLEATAVNFTEAILGLLKCKAVKATYSTEILLDYLEVRENYQGIG